MIWIGIAVPEGSHFGRQILLGVAVITALLGARAFGADLDLRALPGASPDWSGLYFGIGLGARANAVDANATSATVGTPPVPIPLPIAASGDPNALAFWQQQQGAQQYLDNIALRGGIYAGWNFQVAPSYVCRGGG